MKTVDLSKILRPYEDKWVALSQDEKKVIGSGKTLKETSKEVSKKRYKNPVYLKVPRFDVEYVPKS
ncbi:hypothetical protein ES702_06673 [subsurface metagenome]